MKIKISDIKPNPSNPRIIKDDKFKKLVQSIKDFPQMLELRPIVINSDNIVLGGNMRLRACKEAGLKEVPVMRADDLTPEQQAEFVIKDNASYGEWDWDILANEWDLKDLKDWGVDPAVINYEEFKPNFLPDTNYSDVTKEQILKEAERLANQMLKEKQKMDLICPNCGLEFQVNG
jgi:ParB-like chromosome segregation protein Spo0J